MRKSERKNVGSSKGENEVVKTERFRSRLQKDKRRQTLTIWLGAGYGALLLFLTTNLFDQCILPRWLKPLEITLILLGGAATGMARVGYEWEATQLERRAEDGKISLNGVATVQELRRSRKRPERWYDISLLCLAVAGFVVLVAAWWPYVDEALKAWGEGAGIKP